MALSKSGLDLAKEARLDLIITQSEGPSSAVGIVIIIVEPQPKKRRKFAEWKLIFRSYDILAKKAAPGIFGPDRGTTSSGTPT